MFETELSDLIGRSSAGLRPAWIRVVERVVMCGLDKEGLRSLTRQGVGRFSCLAQVMVLVGDRYVRCGSSHVITAGISAKRSRQGV